ncbi:MAG: phosphate transport system permease protein, partial [Pseudonocardiales bacterium]|nr:phosphate transport system permease protein [Pseudonocardiales bacterium]
TSSTAFGGSLFDGGATFASKIALSFAELNNALSAGAYIAAGLVLFILTFAVNALARWIVSRGVPQA